MDQIFAVFRQGVYRHEIVGLFLTEAEARAAAEAAAKSEGDDYHSFDVLKCNIGIAEDDGWLVASLDRKDDVKDEKVDGRLVRRILGTNLSWKNH